MFSKMITSIDDCGISDGVMVGKLDIQTFLSEFDSH